MKIAYLFSLLLLSFFIPFVTSADVDLSVGDYLIYRGHKRIEIFDLNSESVVGSYNLDDIYPATDYWYYNHNAQGSGVLSDDFIFYAFQGQNADNLLAVDLESGDSYDSGLGRSHDDARDYSYAGITSSVAGSIVVPFYRSGACGYQYFSGVTLDPSLIDYYQLGNSYYTSNVRRHGDYYYLFSWTSSTLRIHRIDPETHVLDRAISTSSTSAYRGSTLTPEGYLAVVDGLKKLRIYDYSQEAGSELIFTGTLVGDPSETAGIPLWFYGATYEQGFYYYSPASKRIYDNSIVSGSVFQNWQTDQFGGGNWGDLFNPSITGDYLYTIDYTGSGRATLRRHLKIDGSIDNTFSVLTYDGLDDDDSGFMLTSRIGEIVQGVIPYPEYVSAVYAPNAYITSVFKSDQTMIHDDDPDWEDYWGDYTDMNYSVDLQFSVVNTLGDDIKYLYFSIRKATDSIIDSVQDFQLLDRLYASVRYYPSGVPSYTTLLVKLDLLDPNITDFLASGKYYVYTYLAENVNNTLYDTPPGANEYPQKVTGVYSSIHSFRIYGLPQWREVENWQEDTKVYYEERQQAFEDAVLFPDWIQRILGGMTDFWDRAKVRFPFNIPYALYLSFDTARTYFEEYSDDPPSWDILIPATALPGFVCDDEECGDDEGLLIFSSDYISDNPVLSQDSSMEDLNWLEFFRQFMTYFMWVGFAFYVFTRTMRTLIVRLE